MDNPQDQPGTPSRSPQNPATTPGAAGNPRKATTPNAPAPLSAPAAALSSPSPTPVSTGTTRLSESPQGNSSESNILDTAVQGGKKWIEDSGLLSSTKQLPQTLKDLGNRAVARVNDLSTTQKVVGGTLLAVGLGWLATRKGKSSDGGSSAYNYGSPRDNNGSYGRRTAGYQAPDASDSRAGTRRADSGTAYGSGSRYGNTEKTGSGSGFGASAQADHDVQAGFGNKSDDFRNVE